MNDIIKSLIELEEKELSYEEFSELHELWKVVSRSYFAQIARNGDLLGAGAVLDRLTK